MTLVKHRTERRGLGNSSNKFEAYLHRSVSMVGSKEIVNCAMEKNMFIQQIAGTLSPTFGIFTLHRNGTRTSTGNCIGTIGTNCSEILALARTSVNISTWYYTFPVPVPAPFPYSVNIPLQRS